jgi:hypothetical protein
MKKQMALFAAPLLLTPAAMAQQTVTVPSLSTIMLPSLNADGGALNHVTNLPTSTIPVASVPIAVSTAGTVQLVAAVLAKAIYVTDWDAVAGPGRSSSNMGLARIARQGRRRLPARTPQRLSLAGRAWVTSSFRPATRSAS